MNAPQKFINRLDEALGVESKDQAIDVTPKKRYFSGREPTEAAYAAKNNCYNCGTQNSGKYDDCYHCGVQLGGREETARKDAAERAREAAPFRAAMDEVAKKMWQ